MFYLNSISVIANHLTQPVADGAWLDEDEVQSVIFAVDLLNKCIIDDNVRAKDVFDQNQIFSKVIPKLWVHSNQYINLYVVKFYKCLLFTKFIPYRALIFKLNLLDDVILKLDVLVKWNTLHSAILDLLSFISTTVEMKDFADLLYQKHSEVIDRHYKGFSENSSKAMHLHCIK